MSYGYKFVYQNHTFKGVNKFNNKIKVKNNFEKVLRILKLPDLKIDYKKYSYEEFYKKYEKMNPEIKKEDRPDVFLCLETNEMYIPGNDGLFKIKRLDKIRRLLINEV